MYEYPTYQNPVFGSPRASSFENPAQNDQWNSAPRVAITQAKLPREISDELTQKLSMRQKTMGECKKGPSIDMIKRKFEPETAQQTQQPQQPQQSKVLSTPSVSVKKSNHIINNTLEESYWAQWKPSSCMSNDIKRDPSFGKRSQFTVNSTNNRCNVDSLTFCEGKKLIEEKSLKVLRKPMDMADSNSSEGDKNIHGKLCLNNPCDRPMINNHNDHNLNYGQTYPQFTASMPNYHSAFYYEPNDLRYHERVKPSCRRQRYPKQDGSDIPKPDDKNDDRKRTKSVDKKEIKKSGRRNSKSNEDIKNHVRFCTKNCSEDSNEDSETYSKQEEESTWTIDGYHGDVDTESQIENRKCYCDSYEEEYSVDNNGCCYCQCCHESCWDENYIPSDNTSDNGMNYQVYRYEQVHNPYKSKDKSGSNSSYFNHLKALSSYSSTSRSDYHRKKEVSKAACGCNTEGVICHNKSCETAQKLQAEKKIGDDTPGVLNVIKEKPETLVSSNSSSKSDQFNQNSCRCCNEAACKKSSSGTFTSPSSRQSKTSSTPSSRDTIAVAVGSSNDVHQDASFILDEPHQHYSSKQICRCGSEHKTTDSNSQSSESSDLPNLTQEQIDEYLSRNESRRESRNRSQRSNQSHSGSHKSYKQSHELQNQMYLDQSHFDKSRLDQSQLNQTQLNQTELNQTELNQTELNQTELNQIELNQSQLNETQLNQSELNQLQLDESQLDQSKLNQSKNQDNQQNNSTFQSVNQANETNDPTNQSKILQESISNEFTITPPSWTQTETDSNLKPKKTADAAVYTNLNQQPTQNSGIQKDMPEINNPSTKNNRPETPRNQQRQFDFGSKKGTIQSGYARPRSPNVVRQKHFITDSTQTEPGITRAPKVEATQTVPTESPRPKTPQRDVPSLAASEKTQTDFSLNGGTQTDSKKNESTFNDSKSIRSHTDEPIRNIPIRSLYSKNDQKADRNVQRERNYDGMSSYLSHEQQIYINGGQHFPTADNRIDENHGDFDMVTPSESRNSGYITTHKSLVLQRTPRYTPLKGHTYTLRAPAGGRTTKSPKRKR